MKIPTDVAQMLRDGAPGPPRTSHARARACEHARGTQARGGREHTCRQPQQP